MRFDDLCKKLKSFGIEGAEHEAALLAEKFCGISPTSIRIEKDKELSSPGLVSAIEKRAEGYPLQYILGEWYFCREKYLVNESCLIPRADTELLVELASERLPKNGAFADLCTGSGCIAISTLAFRKDCRGFGFELYEKTLALAGENAALNGVSDRLDLRRADVLKPICFEGLPLFDAIISNPPYIRSADICGLSREVRHEPIAALDGGEDGLIFYRAILDHQLHLLKDGGFIAFEIGYDQGKELCELADRKGFSCEIIKDLGGNDRVAYLKKSI